MRPVWRVGDVRAAEAGLMATLPTGALMARAAAGLARRCALLLADRGGVYGGRVLLLVGSGDNGGDALLAGAHLARRGAAVEALLLSPGRAHADGLAALRAAGGRTVAKLPARADLVLDGIVGIGGSGGLRESVARLVARLGEVRGRDGGRATVVAVDVPSGVAVDTGHVPHDSDGRPGALRADVTVTFGALKPALVVGEAAAYAGQVELVDIGLGPWLRATPALHVTEVTDVVDGWPRLGPASEKYNRGVVGLATGSATYPGAAVLSVAGALAGPTGLVRYAGSAAAEVLRHHPSVIATGRVADAGRVQAWVCGSGLGTGAEAVAELRTVLAAPVPVVLDADALTMLVDGSMADRLRGRDAPIVVTPHDREYARLCGEEPGADRVAATLRLAAWMNAVVLLKGSRTVVGTPAGRAYVNPTGTPVLATGGTGDVLAGLLGSLLAAGLPAERAAALAAYLHGLAGREAARHGPVTATDVAAALRPVLAGLG
ncbi:bifunctional ADP-dependent NAD(P)H-hydrate dehydratase/NAD(P)H-hydrate epimerase [Micromonospora echinospora]|uniref:Bifunctional NAD(P)H-hydrate repair enzyme n=1 Tax=Micromonospora echinospora TaxID=1877 RepID=A0A1C4XB85_MICEC|nr:NAD(P)H-hydrate dehydratase [Micromonospora echinospora]OZV82301.1 bifunctional ADP-dependent NAD(P)H-hydrate dehydratase/NAD(P)H-hydrate epimerase [Micromonospora echinospora]SCF05726.1 yjeF C-terminal region, hydroxyethylthiazole kinase-related/yjeF N-terminal region [Micromonospora echinospora]